MIYYELEPENNSFYIITADITHKCNMTCSNCYVPNRSIPDMDLDKLYDLIKRLPRRCEIRLIGGEPTLHPKLADIIRQVRRLGHRPVILTNGLKFADFDYAKKISEAGLRSFYLSFNGVDLDEWYLQTDQMACAEKKLKALDNAVELKMFVALGCIIQKGVNDLAPSRLLSVINRYKSNNIVLRFKNVGQLGRFSQSAEEAYSFDELIQLVCKQLGVDAEYAKSQRKVSGYDEKNILLFEIPNSTSRGGKTTVKITDWIPQNDGVIDPGSKRRGRITTDFKIAPFTEHIKLNEFGY